MRAVLVNPALAWDGLDGSWIRHGIGLISSYAKSKGHEVSLIDWRRHSVNCGDGTAKVDGDSIARELDGDVYGISILSANFEFALAMVDLIRKVDPTKPIVVGGIHPTVMVEDFENIDVDYIVFGEGEITFTDILESSPTRQKAPVAIWGKQTDLDSLPFVDRDLFDPYDETPIGYLPKPFHTTIVGRGCPYKCTFCAPAEKTLFGKKVRMRSVDNIISELELLKEKYGLRSFNIHDDCAFSFFRWCEEFVEKLSKSKVKGAEFFMQGRADNICKRPDLIHALREAGLRGISVGFESGSQRVLDFLDKGTTVEQNYKAAEILAREGVAIWANLMMGIPTETPKEVMDTVEMGKFFRKLQPQAILSTASYTPHPGSYLYDYVKERNLSLVKHYADYRRYMDGVPKIKGVDYGFLAQAISQMQGNSGRP